MKYLTLVGALGDNAAYKNENGREYVQLSVADNNTYTDANGVQHEEVQWVSCFLRGRNERLLPYLVKGQSVMVCGRMSTRVYSSKKQRAMVAGVSIDVDKIELVGGRPSLIPSTLFDAANNAHRVQTLYYCPTAKNLRMTYKNKAFNVDANGFVYPDAANNVAQQPANAANNVAQQPANAAPAATAANQQQQRQIAASTGGGIPQPTTLPPSNPVPHPFPDGNPMEQDYINCDVPF